MREVCSNALSALVNPSGVLVVACAFPRGLHPWLFKVNPSGVRFRGNHDCLTALGLKQSGGAADEPICQKSPPGSFLETATRFCHADQGCRALGECSLGIADTHRSITFPDRNAVPSRAIRCRGAVRVTESRWDS